MHTRGNQVAKTRAFVNYFASSFWFMRINQTPHKNLSLLYNYGTDYWFTLELVWSNGLLFRALNSKSRGLTFKNHWLAPGSTQPFILPRLVKWVSGFSGNSVLKSKQPPPSGFVTLRQLTPRPILKGCVCYILASLFFKSNRENFSNQGKYALYHFKSPFRWKF